MGIRMPCVSNVKDILQRSSSFRWSSVSTIVDVLKGCLAIYVRESQSGYVVPVSYLNEPIFQELLSKAEEEFGFDHPKAEEEFGFDHPKEPICREDVFTVLISILNRI